MTTITTADLQNRFSDVMAHIASGEEVLVTEQGQPVARIVPPDTADSTPKEQPEVKPQETAEEWVARWLAWTKSHAVHTGFVDDSRESIYAGCGE